MAIYIYVLYDDNAKPIYIGQTTNGAITKTKSWYYRIRRPKGKGFLKGRLYKFKILKTVDDPTEALRYKRSYVDKYQKKGHDVAGLSKGWNKGLTLKYKKRENNQQVSAPIDSIEVMRLEEAIKQNEKRI
jgi:hypothetical protein